MEKSDHQIAVTQRDVARVLGLDHSTVSLALRDSPKITEARRAQIQTAAREMGYRPNAMAAALSHHKRVSGVHPTSAALAWLNLWPKPEQLRGFKEFDGYWRGACACAEKFGYRLEEFACDENMAISRIEKILKARNIQGILLPPAQTKPEWGDFHWERYSAVRFGRSIVEPRVHIVGSDHVANTILAFDQIRARGYRRVGFVGGLSRHRGHWFEAGFLFSQRFIEPKLRLPILSIDESDHGRGRRELGQWLKMEKPDAVFTDVAAMPDMLKTLGYRVPDDIGLAVTSVLDGNADAGIDQHPEEIGRVGLLVVLSLINDNARGLPAVFRQILVEGRWVDGSSLPSRT